MDIFVVKAYLCDFFLKSFSPMVDIVITLLRNWENLHFRHLGGSMSEVWASFRSTWSDETHQYAINQT